MTKPGSTKDWTRLVLFWSLVIGHWSFGSPAPEPTQFPFAMVRLPAGWFAGRDPVTQGQFAEVTDENPSHFPGDNDQPVENVSWEDATAFCEQLTTREHTAGRLPPGWRYDLPTDAQWDEMLADADLRTAVTSLTTPRESTVPVAEAGPTNRLGLRGMLGNVWQWCRDWYDEGIRRKDSNPDVPAGALVNPPGNATVSPDDPPDERYKVLRGGAWDTGVTAGFTPRARLRYAPGMSNAHTGFRCVLEYVGENAGR